MAGDPSGNGKGGISPRVSSYKPQRGKPFPRGLCGGPLFRRTGRDTMPTDEISTEFRTALDRMKDGSSTDGTEQVTLTGEVRTRLVNQEWSDRYTVDIGRANNGESHMNNTPVGEPGWLGNPYPESEYGRDRCIEMFREDFEERIESDPEFRSAVENLRGETLGCYCKPKPCHGDVILGYIRSVDTGTDQ